LKALVKRAASCLSLAMYCLLTFGCGGNTPDSKMTSSTSPQVRVVQGGADAVGFDVVVNGAKAQTATPFATPPYFPVTGANIHVEEVPSGTTGPAIVDAMYAVAASSYNTVMIVGEEGERFAGGHRSCR
jgi:hypothetical protein